MKLVTKQIILVIMLLTFVGLVQACTGSSKPQVNSPSTPKEALSASPVFKVSSLTINPPEANTGVQVIVTAKVTNTGSATDNYTPKIRIDNVTGGSLPTFKYLEELEINAGATELLSLVKSGAVALVAALLLPVSA